MPPRVHHVGSENTFANFYFGLPLVTRTFATVCLATAALAQLKLLNPGWIYLDWWLIFRRLQVWRLLTPFSFVGGFSLRMVINLVWMWAPNVQYGKPLEATTYQHSRADYIYMFLFGMAVMLASTAVVPGYFLAESLVYMVVYVWSRNFPTNNVSIMGLFMLQAFYLPFALAALDLMLGAGLTSSLRGIVVGHLYYFLKSLHPAAGGRTLLDTPRWLHRLTLRAGMEATPIHEAKVRDILALVYWPVTTPGRHDKS